MVTTTIKELLIKNLLNYTLVKDENNNVTFQEELRIISDIPV